MTYDDLATLRVRLEQRVLFATVDAPPMNLLGIDLLLDLDQLGQRCEADEAVSVVVLDSADPHFFIAHGDVASMSQLDGPPPPPSNDIGFVHGVLHRFSTMAKVSIAKIQGAARGGGCEVAMAMDMRFGALETTVLGQPETAMGIIPGAGGTQRLPRLIGRPRALEMILGCRDIDATEAERYGYLNRALPAAELDGFVDALAFRIAALPPAAIAAAKAATDRAAGDVVAGYQFEEQSCNELLYGAEAQRRLQGFLDIGGQTRHGEADFDSLVDALVAIDPPPGG